MSKFVLIICTLLLTNGLFAQSLKRSNTSNANLFSNASQASILDRNGQKTPKEWLSRMKYGGNFGLSYWNGAYIEVSPMAGYKLNESGSTVVGLGLNLMYTSNRYSNYSALDYGFRIFLEQNITSFLTLHGELETMSAQSSRFVDFPQGSAGGDVRKWETYPQVGLMFYPNKIGGNTDGISYYIALMYNLNYPNAGYIGTGYYMGNGLTIKFGYF